jgi:ammonia channel protein AmtB
MGLRVTKEEEIDGLDIHEHGTIATMTNPVF